MKTVTKHGVRIGYCLGQPCQPSTDQHHAYTDGSGHGGIGVRWDWPDGNHSYFMCCVKEKDTNTTEMSAIFFAVLFSDTDKDLTVYTDSQTCLYFLVNAKLTDKRRMAHLARLIMWLTRHRQASTSFVKIKAHAGIEGNEHADRLALQGRAIHRPCPKIPWAIDRSTLEAYINNCGLDVGYTVLASSLDL